MSAPSVQYGSYVEAARVKLRAMLVLGAGFGDEAAAQAGPPKQAGLPTINDPRYQHGHPAMSDGGNMWVR